MDYTLKSNDERVVVNDYIENDPLSENNLDNTLNLANEFRLSSPQKSIWLYTGFTYEEIMKYEYDTTHINNTNCDALRQAIICQCDVLVGGRYIDSQRDITLKYRGSKNQRVIDIQKTLKQGEIVLWCKSKLFVFQVFRDLLFDSFA